MDARVQSHHRGNDETGGQSFAGVAGGAAEPGVTRALSFVAPQFTPIESAVAACLIDGMTYVEAGLIMGSTEYIWVQQ